MVERCLAKANVASSNLVFRSKKNYQVYGLIFCFTFATFALILGSPKIFIIFRGKGETERKSKNFDDLWLPAIDYIKEQLEQTKQTNKINDGMEQ